MIDFGPIEITPVDEPPEKLPTRVAGGARREARWMAVAAAHVGAGWLKIDPTDKPFNGGTPAAIVRGGESLGLETKATLRQGSIYARFDHKD